MSMSDVLNEFQVQTPNVGDKKLNVTLPNIAVKLPALAVEI